MSEVSRNSCKRFIRGLRIGGFIFILIGLLKWGTPSGKGTAFAGIAMLMIWLILSIGVKLFQKKRYTETGKDEEKHAEKKDRLL